MSRAGLCAGALRARVALPPSLASARHSGRQQFRQPAIPAAGRCARETARAPACPGARSVGVRPLPGSRQHRTCSRTLYPWLSDGRRLAHDIRSVRPAGCCDARHAHACRSASGKPSPNSMRSAPPKAPTAVGRSGCRTDRARQVTARGRRRGTLPGRRRGPRADDVRPPPSERSMVIHYLFIADNFAPRRRPISGAFHGHLGVITKPRDAGRFAAVQQ